MDVRCEKCQTEYELDETKVSEVGVTVKCTTCGFLFRVRRKPTAPVTTPRAPTHLPADQSAGTEDKTEKLWMIRSPVGEISRFRELTTLQQWIVERKVTRHCEISRTGDTWKLLGEIAELASFFLVVDQAEAAARAAEAQTGGQRTSTMPFQSRVLVAPAHAGSAAPRDEKTPPVGYAAGRSKTASHRPATGGDSVLEELPTTIHNKAVAPSPSMKKTLLGPQVAAPAPTRPPTAQAVSTAPVTLGASAAPVTLGASAAPASAGPSERSRDGIPRMTGRERSGPTGGLQGASVAEPAFANAGADAAMRRARASLSNDASYTGMPHERMSGSLDAVAEPRRRKVPLLVLLPLLLAGGAGLGYLVVSFIAGGKSEPAAVVAASDAAPAALAALPVIEAATDKAYDEALARFDQDTDQAFADAEKLLEKARVADPARDAKALAAQALVNSTWAQYLLDDAQAVQVSDPRKAEQLRAESQRKADRAQKFATDSLARVPDNVDGLVASADAQRLARKKVKASEIEKLLKGAGSHADVSFVRAMLRLREGDVASATTLLRSTVDTAKRAGHEHLRARFRLAQIAFDARRYDEVKSETALIIGAQPQHARAQDLAERASAAAEGVGQVQDLPPAEGTTPPTVATTPPPPAATTPAATTSKPAATTPVTPTVTPLDNDRDALLKKATRLAENDRCAEARGFYEKVLDASPADVEALTGLGYCHIDAGEFAAAQAKFRAALGVSPRYAEALNGIAEAYRFQGLKDKAIESYKKYLEIHPTGRHAGAARRYLDLMAPKPAEPAPATPPASSEPAKAPAEPTPSEAPSKPTSEPASPPAAAEDPAPSGGTP